MTMAAETEMLVRGILAGTFRGFWHMWVSLTSINLPWEIFASPSCP